VLYEQHRLDEAAVMAQRAEHGFAHLGDDERRMTALYLRGSIKFEARHFDDAAALFRHVIEYGESMNSTLWVARGSNALGKCDVHRGNLNDASLHFHKALSVFRESGSASERLTTEWGIAQVLMQSGKVSEAIRRLRDVAADFETRGMVTDAALVRLDIADALLAMGQSRQIVDLATRLFHVFTHAGMLTGALTAIAYVKEAAAAGTLTPEDVQAVRTSFGAQSGNPRFSLSRRLRETVNTLRAGSPSFSEGALPYRQRTALAQGGFYAIGFFECPPWRSYARAPSLASLSRCRIRRRC
jgi:tetratricopeptide (TPR) repeat protein